MADLIVLSTGDIPAPIHSTTGVKIISWDPEDEHAISGTDLVTETLIWVEAPDVFVDGDIVSDSAQSSSWYDHGDINDLDQRDDTSSDPGPWSHLVLLDTDPVFPSVFKAEAEDDTHVAIYFATPMMDFDPASPPPGYNATQTIRNKDMHTITGSSWPITVESLEYISNKKVILTVTSMDGDEFAYLYEAALTLLTAEDEVLLDNDVTFAGIGVAPVMEEQNPDPDEVEYPVTDPYYFRILGGSEIDEGTVQVRFKEHESLSWVWMIQDGVYNTAQNFTGSMVPYGYPSHERGREITINHPTLLNDIQYDISFYAKQLDGQWYNTQFTFTTLSLFPKVEEVTAFDDTHIDVRFSKAMKRTNSADPTHVTYKGATGLGGDDSHKIEGGDWTIELHPTDPIVVIQADPTIIRIPVTSMDGDATEAISGPGNNYLYTASAAFQATNSFPLHTDFRTDYFDGIGEAPDLRGQYPPDLEEDVLVDADWEWTIQGGSHIDPDTITIGYRLQGDTGAFTRVCTAGVPAAGWAIDVSVYGAGNGKGRVITMSQTTPTSPLNYDDWYELQITASQQDSQTYFNTTTFETAILQCHVVSVIAYNHTHIDVLYDMEMQQYDLDSIPPGYTLYNTVMNPIVHQISGGDWTITAAEVTVLQVNPTKVRVRLTSMDGDARGVNAYLYTANENLLSIDDDPIGVRTANFDGIGRAPYIVSSDPDEGQLEFQKDQDFFFRLDAGSLILDTTVDVRYGIKADEFTLPTVWTQAVTNGSPVGDHTVDIVPYVYDGGAHAKGLDITVNPGTDLDPYEYYAVEIHAECQNPSTGEITEIIGFGTFRTTANLINVVAEDDTHVLLYFDRDMKYTNKFSTTNVTNWNVHTIHIPSGETWIINPNLSVDIAVVTPYHTFRVTVNSMDGDTIIGRLGQYTWEIADTVRSIDDKIIEDRFIDFDGEGRLPELVSSYPAEGDDNVSTSVVMQLIMDGGFDIDFTGNTIQVSYEDLLDVIGPIDAIIDSEYVGGHTGFPIQTYNYNGKLINIRHGGLVENTQYQIAYSATDRDGNLLTGTVNFDTIEPYCELLKTVYAEDDTHIVIEFSQPMRDTVPAPDNTHVTNLPNYTINGGDWDIDVTAIANIDGGIGKQFRLTVTSMDGDEENYFFDCGDSVYSDFDKPIRSSAHTDFFAGVGLAPFLAFTNPSPDDIDASAFDYFQIKIDGGSTIEWNNVSWWYKVDGAPSWIEAVNNGVSDYGATGCTVVNNPYTYGDHSKGRDLKLFHPPLLGNTLYRFKIMAEANDGQTLDVEYTFTTEVTASIIDIQTISHTQFDVYFDIPMKRTGGGDDDITEIYAPSGAPHGVVGGEWEIKASACDEITPTQFRVTIVKKQLSGLNEMDGDTVAARLGQYFYSLNNTVTGENGEPLSIREWYFDGEGRAPELVSIDPADLEDTIGLNEQITLTIDGGSELDLWNTLIQYRKVGAPSWTVAYQDHDWGDDHSGIINNYSYKGRTFIITHDVPWDADSTYEINIQAQQQDLQTLNVTTTFDTITSFNIIDVTPDDDTHVTVTFNTPFNTTQILNGAYHTITSEDDTWDIVISEIVILTPTTIQLTINSMDGDADYTYWLDPEHVFGLTGEPLVINEFVFNGLGTPPVITVLTPIPDDLKVDYDTPLAFHVSSGADIDPTQTQYWIKVSGDPWAPNIIDGGDPIPPFEGAIIDFADPKGIKVSVTHPPFLPDTDYEVHIEVVSNDSLSDMVEYSFSTPAEANVTGVTVNDCEHITVYFDTDMKNTDENNPTHITYKNGHGISGGAWPISVLEAISTSSTSVKLTTTPMDGMATLTYTASTSFRGLDEEPMATVEATFPGKSCPPEIVEVIPYDYQPNTPINTPFEVKIKAYYTLNSYSLNIWYKKVGTSWEDIPGENWVQGMDGGNFKANHIGTLATYDMVNRGRYITLPHPNLVPEQNYLILVEAAQQDGNTVSEIFHFVTAGFSSLGVIIENVHPPQNSTKAPPTAIIHFDLTDQSGFGIDITYTKIYIGVNEDPTTLVFDDNVIQAGDWEDSEVYHTIRYIELPETPDPFPIYDKQHFIFKYNAPFNYDDVVSIKVMAQESSGLPHKIEKTWSFNIQTNPCWEPTDLNRYDFEKFLENKIAKYPHLENIRNLLISNIAPEGTLAEQIRRVFQIAFNNGLNSYLNEIDIDWSIILNSNICSAWPIITLWNLVGDKLHQETVLALDELDTIYKKEFLSTIKDALQQAKVADRFVGLSATALLIGAFSIFNKPNE